MSASRKISLCFSFSLLLIVVLVIWNPFRDQSPEEKAVSKPPAAQETAASQLEKFGPNSELDDPYSPESALPPPSGKAHSTSLSRSTHHQLLLPPHRTLDRIADTSVVFEAPIFQVNAGAPTGPLSLNEHTLSAVEADYDPRVIEQFLQSDAGAVRLPLDGEKSVVLEVSRVVSRGPVTTSLIGKIANDPFSDVTMVFHDGVVSGSVAFVDKDIHYQFGSAGNGKVAIRRLDPSTFTARCEKPHGSSLLASDAATSGNKSEIELPSEAEVSAPEETAPPAPSEEADNPLPDVESDALVTMDTVTGYGMEARIAEGGVAAIEALIIASVDRTNTAFLNSQIADTELVLLGTIEDPDYVFPGLTAGTMGSADELGDLNNASDGILDAVTDLKVLVGADHAGFVVKQTDGSAGVAYRPGQSMIVARTYMTSTRLTFVHEFGHNIGCRHAWGDSGGNNSKTVANYGWRLDPPSSSKVRTVMAYDWGWTRIPHFSDPDILYNGAKTGAVDGYDATGDATADPRAVSGGYQDSHGSGYDGTNPSLGARNADYIQANAQFVADNATRVVAPPGPEISVHQPSGTNLTDGVAVISFGTEEAGASSSRIFTIKNDGGADLTGLGITIDGTDASEFSVTALPTAPVSSSGSTTFTVDWNPLTSGSKTATLHVASNDTDENPFDIGLVATATDPAPRLSGLSLSAGALDPSFQPEIFSYFAGVGTGTSSVTVTPFTTQPGASIHARANGGSYVPVSSGSPSSALNLTVGSNVIDVRITSASGSLTQVYSLSIDRGVQEITFPPVESRFSDSGSFSLNATASSGLPVSYTITAGSGVATISGNTVSLTGTAGPVTIQASQGGDGNFAAANDVYVTFYVLEAQSPILETACGRDFNVILRQDGTLWSWGSNVLGFLGVGDQIDRRSPVRIGTDTDWTAVRAGASHTLALKTNGTLWAWGYNYSGRLGDGTTSHRISPVQIGSDSDWETIAAGDDCSFAIKSNGTLWAWGEAGSYQLGTGSTIDQFSPVQIGTDTNWDAASCGDRHVIALKSNGTLWAWGTNTYGQVGNGSTTTVQTPTQIGAEIIWEKIFAGHDHSLAIKTDGSLWAWGRNNSGRLGDGTTSNRNAPVQVGSDLDWEEISAGNSFSLGRKSNGTLWGWGGNIFGELGDTSRTSRFTPGQIGTRNDWSDLAVSNASTYHTVVKGANGFAWTWGGFTLATPRGKGFAAPVLDPSEFSGVALHALGDHYSLAIMNDGSLWSWGDNFNGKLGDGGFVERKDPYQVGTDLDWSAIAAGDNHSLSVKSNGTLWVWGDGSLGQLGQGNTGDSGVPIQVGADSDWEEVAAGDDHSLALKDDGTLWAWGHNLFGQVGNGSTTNQQTPVQIGSGSNWTFISAGDRHNLAVQADGTLWAWGDNDRGQLGDGTFVDSLTPQQVGSDSDWQSASAGQSHSAAIKTDGSLWGWGYNYAGQVGDGTNSNRSLPVRIGVDNDWSEVSSGYAHTLAIKADGSLWAWGDNALAKLGNGEFADVNSPIRVGTWNGWGSLPVSGMSQSFSSIVSGADGTLWGWGDSGRRSLGNASVETRLPKRVLPITAQTLSLPTLNRPLTGQSVSLAGTSTSGLPIRYRVSGAATLAGSVLTVTGTGPISIYAYQEGDVFWDAAQPEPLLLVEPEISVEQPVNTNLSDGSDTIDFSSVAPGSSSSKVFTVRNTGTAVLSGLSLSKSGSHQAEFLPGSLTATSLAPGESATFSISFQPAAIGVRTASVHIASNDLDENPFDIDLAGTGASPEITLEESGSTLTDGSSTTQFGSVDQGSSSTRTYTIRNDGTSPLSGISVSISGTDSGQFSKTNPATNVLGSGASTTFTVTFNPSGSGARSAMLQVFSNDSDENPFDVGLSGTALASQITIEDSGGTPIVSGATTIDYGAVPVGSGTTRNYTVRNTGTATLQITSLQRSGTNPGDFGAGLSGSASLAPGATVTLQTSFNPVAEGARTSELTVFSNSLTNNQFAISLAGSGIAPELSISPLSANKVEGSGTTTPFTFNVSRSGYTSGTTTVSYATTGSGGNPATAGDFQSGFPTGTVSFAANETSKTITIPVNADDFVETSEGFTVTLFNPTGGATFGSPAASGTIQNDDVLTVSIDTQNAGDDTAIEGGSPGILTLTHNEPGRTTPVIVSLSTASSVADISEFSITGSNASFNGATGTITIPANQTSTQASLVALVETIKAAEPAKDVVIQIQSNAGYSIGSPAFTTVTIEQNGFLVTNVNDFDPVTSANAGTGTLRQAVLNANALGGNPTIAFDTANPPFNDTSVDVITLTEGELTLSESLLLDGPGARLLDISGNNSSRIFTLAGGPGSHIILRNLSIRDGSATDGGGILNLSSGPVSIVDATIAGNVATTRGGAIFNNGFSDLSLYESTISGNTGGNTGGIFLETGYVYLRGSTISGNVATSSRAGGATVSVGTTLELANVTVTGNQSPNDGGGIHNAGGSVQPGNTIIAGNNGPASSPDVSGIAFSSSGNNLVGDASSITGPHGFSAPGDQVGNSSVPLDAKLLPLADNGGSTDTHALAGSSPAIEAGSSAAAGSIVSVFDQRGTGFPRTFDRDGDGVATIDIGSFEAGPPTLVINEIEAESAGSDDAEFIEIYDGGIGNTDLDNIVLVFFDGSNDLSYHAIDLTGFSTDGDGYFLLGNSGVAGAAATFADDLLQNGDATGSDAVALFLGNDSNFPNGSAVTTEGVIDALVYKESGQADDPGLTSLLLPGQAELDDNSASNEGGHSLQRFPNGSGAARSTDSLVAMAPTPGAENLAPAAPTTPDLESLSDTGISTSDDITMLARPALSGTGAPGALLIVSSHLDGTLGTTSVGAGGSWTFTPTSDLSDSLHQITVEADGHVQNGSEGLSGSLALQIDTVPPSVTVNQAISQVDPATADPVSFLAVFSESTLSTANGFSSNDVSIAGTAAATTASVLETSPNDGTTFEITISGAAGDGTIEATIPAGAVEDVAGNANTASTGVDNLVTVASELDTPTGISASDLTFPDRIRVSWSPVATAQNYDVYRNTTTDFGSASLVGNADGIESFDDFSANGSPASYFYWVKAKKTVSSVMKESSEGAPDEGSRANDQHGNTAGTATALTFNSGVATVSGTLESGDVDFFTFTLTQPYHLSIFTSGTVDTRGTLRDATDLERNDSAADDNAAGDGLNFRIDTALGQGVYTVEVTSQSPDESGSYALHVELGDLAMIQPDSLVGRGEASLLGDDSYGVAVTLALTSKKARGVRGVFAVENDGEVRDQFTCRASAGNGIFRVTYLTDEGNVTAALIAGTHQPAAMEPGDDRHLINASIRPVRSKIKKVKKRKGKKTVKWLKRRYTSSFVATSTVDETVDDFSAIRVQTK